MYHKAKASSVIGWILKGETLDERQRRIQHFLENEGYLLPGPPKGVDRSEAGNIHIVRGRPMTVKYAVVDQGGRKVYHYRENEIDHIMLRRIEKYDEWALEHLSLFPHILKTGKVVSEEPDKVYTRPGDFIAFQVASALCVLSSNATKRRDGTLTPFTPGIERRIRIGESLDFRFDAFDNYFCLMLADYANGPTGHDDETYDFVLHLIKSFKTGKVVGFSNDSGDLAEDYEKIMRLLRKRPIPGRYDVPKLGLHDATLDEIITTIHRRFVLREGAVEYPTAEERERPLQAVAEEPADLNLDNIGNDTEVIGSGG